MLQCQAFVGQELVSDLHFSYTGIQLHGNKTVEKETVDYVTLCFVALCVGFCMNNCYQFYLCLKQYNAG